MSLFHLFNKKKGLISIEFLQEGMAIVALDAKDSISKISFIGADPNVSLKQQLAEYVSKHGFSKVSCRVVLPSKDYEMLLVEAPSVEAEELKDALKWKVKDLIARPLDQTVIDAFFLPRDGNKSGKKMAYVVATALTRIREIIDLVQGAGLVLQVIETEELALRNLTVLKGTRELTRGVAIARILDGGGLVSLYKDGNLYLSRQFSIEYTGGLLDELPADSFALEIQRSFDYYERQMGLAPPSGLFVCGENITEDKITPEIQRSITVPTHYFDLADQLKTYDIADEAIQHLCVGALGSACFDRSYQ